MPPLRGDGSPHRRKPNCHSNTGINPLYYGGKLQRTHGWRCGELGPLIAFAFHVPVPICVDTYARIPDRNQRSRSIHVPNTPLCITGGLLAPGGSSPWTNRHANANVTHDASALYDDRALRLQYAKPTYLVRSILQGPNLRDFRTAPHHISSDTVPVPVTTTHLRPGYLERVSVCM